MTNQVMSDPGTVLQTTPYLLTKGATLTFVPDPKKAVGGHILGHACTTRLKLRKYKGGQFLATIIESPDMPEAEAVYVVTAGGVEDGEE